MSDPLAGVWCHTPNAPGMQSIVCQSCTEMLEQIVDTHGANGTAPKEITISCNSMTGIKGNAPFAVLRGELQNQKRFPGTYLGETAGGGGSVFRREAPAGSSDDRTSITEPIVFPICKPKAKGKAHASHGKGHRRQGCNNRWTDEESEALLEAVEIHGDDAQAIKADPEFAARLARRSEEAIKTKIERENMFGDSASEEDSADGEDEDDGQAEDITTPREEKLASVTSSSSKRRVGPEVERGKTLDRAVAEMVPAVATTAMEGDSQPSAVTNGKAKPSSATRSESSANVSVPVPVVDGNATRGRSPRSNPADDAPNASSHRSASYRLTTSTTAPVSAPTTAPVVAPVSRSSPRHTPAEETLPLEKPAAKSSTMTVTAAATTTGIVTTSKAPAPAKADEPRAKGKNNELKSLLQDNLAPLPPRRKGKPAAAQSEKSDSESGSGSEDESETIQVPRVLTRRQEQDKEQALLSTRSGKKLFLAGSDLLP